MGMDKFWVKILPEWFLFVGFYLPQSHGNPILTHRMSLVIQLLFGLYQFFFFSSTDLVDNYGSQLGITFAC